MLLDFLTGSVFGLTGVAEAKLSVFETLVVLKLAVSFFGEIKILFSKFVLENFVGNGANFMLLFT